MAYVDPRGPTAPAPPVGPQTATYPSQQSAAQGGNADPFGAFNPGTFQGQALQQPGFGNASAINQALAGTGIDVTPGQVANVPNAGALAGLLQGEAQPALLGLQGQIGLAQSGNTLNQQQIADAMAQQQQEGGYSLAQLGLQGNDLAIQRALLGQTSGPGGFESQQGALTAAEQAQQFAQSKRALQGQNAVSGSTGGNQVTSWSDLLKNYGFQQQQQALTAKEQQAQYAASSAQMGNAAKALGISTQEVQSRLTNALSQLGLQGAMDTTQLMQTIAQLKEGYVSGPLAQIAQQVLQIAGIPLQSIVPGTNANPSTGAGL